MRGGNEEKIKQCVETIIKAERFKGFAGAKLEELVKRRCERERIIFDQGLYEEILEKGRKG